MDTNAILLVVSIVITVAFLTFMYFHNKRIVTKESKQELDTIDKIIENIKSYMIELVKNNYTLGLSDEEFEKAYQEKARLNEALKNCVYGFDEAKKIVIDKIREYIVEMVEDKYVTRILGLENGGLPIPTTQFEIIMYKYKQKCGVQALSEWIEKYDLAREKEAKYSENELAYYITNEELEGTYIKENYNLNIEEQRDILAILVYQAYKGFGIVDTLREMDINGFNMGTSGSIMSATNKFNKIACDNPANNAVWLYYKGKYIHLQFMNYGSEEELKRLIQLMIRYNNPGPLTAKKGYMVNTMYDKSRITALRPPASEFWAVFVRKFSLSDVSPENLIDKPYTVNAQLPINIIKYLMQGQITCGVTGRQGSGKTTLMSSIVRYIDPRYTIRILELAPELYLRELYPTRNILSVQETQTTSATELQDVLKKSDAAVSIVGEVATDEVALRMIQMGMTASLFTIFSHHANTPKDLILTLRNSLVNAGGFNNMQTAEKQVTDVVKVDIHLDYTPDGKRFISRISEIVQLDENIPYPEYDSKNKEDSMNAITKEYYERQTDRVSFITNQLLHYDLDNDTYVIDNKPTEALYERILYNLPKDKKDGFVDFVKENYKEK